MDDSSLAVAPHNFPHVDQDDERSPTLETCFNGRFIKHEDLISKSQYRTIFRGYDNESGCEIAWNVYSLEKVDQNDREKIQQILDHVKTLKHQNILTCIYSFIKNTELVMITELITAGSIREYLKKIKLPRLGVIKKWARKILEGVQYLHSQNFVHGKLTCESIYINSNNGDIKIGDIGIRAIPCYNSKYSELSLCKQLKNSDDTFKLDIYCFGLSLLEMISSDISGTQAFKVLCKIINKGEKQQILSSIVDEGLRDIISRSLESEPENRITLDELIQHPFLQKSENDHNPVLPSLQLTEVIKKYSYRRNGLQRRMQSNMVQNSSVFDGMTTSGYFNGGTGMTTQASGLESTRLQQRVQEAAASNNTINSPITGQNASDCGCTNNTLSPNAKPEQQQQFISKQKDQSHPILIDPSLLSPSINGDSGTSFSKQMIKAGGVGLNQSLNKSHKLSNFHPKVERKNFIMHDQVNETADNNDDNEFDSHKDDSEPAQESTPIVAAQQNLNQALLVDKKQTEQDFSDIRTTIHQVLKDQPSEVYKTKPADDLLANITQQQPQQLIVASKPPQAQRIIQMRIKVLKKQKLLEVFFSYNLEKDTPEGVMSEMKQELDIREENELAILRAQIQKIVEHFSNSSMSDVTYATAHIPGQSSASSQLHLLNNNRTQRIESNGSQEATSTLPQLRSQQVTMISNPPQPQHEEQDFGDLGNASGQQEANSKSHRNTHQNGMTTENQEHEPGREEEAVIIDERGGAQEHHNQTMDEIYHHQNKNTNDEDAGQMIQCNVVSNPINFMNSMILHDKNDLNDPSPRNADGQQEEMSCVKMDQPSKQLLLSNLKKEIEDLTKPKSTPQLQPVAPAHAILPSDCFEMDDTSYSGGDGIYLNEEHEDLRDLQNILKDMFPGYSANYWHENSTSNMCQLQKANSNQHTHNIPLNDTLDLSHCSFFYHVPNQSSTISADHQNNTGKDAIQAHTPSHQQNHHYVHLPFRRENTMNPPPFQADDISIIIHQKGIRHSSTEETKNDINHDQPHDCCYNFLEGMSSLNFNFNLTINQNHHICLQNHQTSGLGILGQGGLLPSLPHTALFAAGSSPHGLTPAATPGAQLSSQPNIMLNNQLSLSSHNDSSVGRMQFKKSLNLFLKRKRGFNNSNQATNQGTVGEGTEGQTDIIKSIKIESGTEEQSSDLPAEGVERTKINQEECKGGSNEEDIRLVVDNEENKDSEMMRIEAGSNFNQNYLLGRISTEEKTTLDGLTPAFMTPRTSNNLNAVQGNPESESQQNQVKDSFQGSVLSVATNSIKLIHHPFSSQGVYQSSSSPTAAIEMTMKNQLFMIDHQMSSDTLAQTQNHKLGLLQVIQTQKLHYSDQSKCSGDEDIIRPQEQQNLSQQFPPPLTTKTNSIIDSRGGNITMVKNNNGTVSAVMIKTKSFADRHPNSKRFHEQRAPETLQQLNNMKNQMSDNIAEQKRKLFQQTPIAHRSSPVAHKSSHVLADVCRSLLESNEKLSPTEDNKDEHLIPAIPLSGDGSKTYFHFDNQYSHHNHMNNNLTLDGACMTQDCIHNQMFRKQMRSEKLQRKNKQMYRDDIKILQEALKRINKRDRIGTVGHYCEETCKYVKRFQEMYNYLQDGIVDSSLWKSIMGEAIRTPCFSSHPDDYQHQHSLSNEIISLSERKPQQLAQATTNKLPSSSTSNFDLQSSSASPTHNTPLCDSSYNNGNQCLAHFGGASSFQNMNSSLDQPTYDHHEEGGTSPGCCSIPTSSVENLPLIKDSSDCYEDTPQLMMQEQLPTFGGEGQPDQINVANEEIRILDSQTAKNIIIK